MTTETESTGLENHELVNPAPNGGLISPDSTLRSTFHLWQETLRLAALSEFTRRNYLADMQLLAIYLPEDQPVSAITTEQLNQFLHWMRYERGRACADKTLDRRITTLKSYFRWLLPTAPLLTDPAADVVNVSVRSPLIPILSEGEMKSVLQVAEQLRDAPRKPDPRPHVLLTLVLETALRKGEVVRLRHEHIHTDPDDGYCFVEYLDKRHRHKERKVPLTPEWIAAYQAYCPLPSPEATVFPWSVRRLEYLLEDVAKLAGISTRLSFDSLRWTAALRDYRSQMESEPLRRKLGLSKIQWAETRRKLSQLAAAEEGQ